MTPTHTTETLPDTRRALDHEHAWLVESAHNTSDGRVLYVRCVSGCGARRIDLQGPADVPACAVSREVGR